MTAQQKTERRIFYTMALVGGFMGGYAFFRSDILGSAQTINLISLVWVIIGRDTLHIIIRLGAAVLYALAFVLAVMVQRRARLNLKLTAVAVDAVCVLALCLIPRGLDPVLALYPIFFMMAFQWYSFPGALGYTSATVFSTNNYRQTIVGLTNYFADHDREQLRKAGFFAGSLLSFHAGVAAAFIGALYLHYDVAWLCFIPLAFAAVQIKSEQSAAKAALLAEEVK